ncbi:hypothetical protein DSO57_1038161 [Entomophthora muscae]|uniref:Uncharacterized protein n=1 Tax=Entomophthora muscae TaxID=34485 RepID=A0ACC2TWZ3_9FUNG|nr:hypothetical protein DSO57_1038161 [Entomophthora muscae]
MSWYLFGVPRKPIYLSSFHLPKPQDGFGSIMSRNKANRLILAKAAVIDAPRLVLQSALYTLRVAGLKHELLILVHRFNKVELI